MANLSYTAAEIDERLGKTDDIGDLTELETTDKSSVVDAINELFTSVSDGKTAIAAAITDKGVPTAATDSFTDMADNIADIQTGGTLQTKTATPTENTQAITADVGYDGLAEVDVAAIPSSYVGSGVTRRSSSDLTVSGTTVSVPAGYYENAASKSVESKAVQIAAGVNRATTSTLAAVSGQSISVAKSGTYDVYWGGFRSSTSGTSGSQLYKNNTAYGTENTTFTNHGQSVHLSNVSLNQGDVIQVYARSRGSNYYMYVSNLTIIEA